MSVYQVESSALESSKGLISGCKINVVLLKVPWKYSVALVLLFTLSCQIASLNEIELSVACHDLWSLISHDFIQLPSMIYYLFTQSCKSNYECASFELGASCFSYKGGMGRLGEHYIFLCFCYLFFLEGIFYFWMVVLSSYRFRKRLLGNFIYIYWS